MLWTIGVEAVNKLAMLCYYAVYGVYVPFLCTSFRQHCVSAKVKNVEILIGKSWSQVNDEVKAETEKKTNWLAMFAEPPPPTAEYKRPTRSMVDNACIFLGLNSDKV